MPAKCDCLIWCGDDPWLADGRATPCERALQRAREAAAERARVARQQYLLAITGHLNVMDALEELARLRGMVVDVIEERKS